MNHSFYIITKTAEVSLTICSSGNVSYHVCQFKTTIPFMCICFDYASQFDAWPSEQAYAV